MKAAPLADQEFRQRRNRLAATVVLGHWVKHIYTSGLTMLIWPEIRIGLGLSYGQLGSLASAKSVSAWLSTMTAGYLGDRFTSRASLLLGISLSLLGFSFLLAGFAPNYLAMLAVMLVLGVGPALYHPPAIGELSRRFPERRGFAISLHGMGGTAGEVVGPLVVAGLFTFMAWRDVLKGGLFPALIAALLIWASMRSVPRMEPQAQSRKAYIASLGGLLHNRVLLLLIAVVAIRGMGQSAVESFLTVYLRDDALYSTTKIAFIVSAAQVVGFAAQPAMGYLSDRFGRQSVLIPGLVIGTAMTFALGIVEPGAVLVFVVIARGMFKFSLHHIFVAAAIDAADGQVQSTIVSMVYGSGVLGTISPTIAGLISDRYGIQSSFMYAGSLSLIALLLLMALKLPKTAAQRKAEGVGG